MFGGVEPGTLAGELIGAEEGDADLGGDVELDFGVALGEVFTGAEEAGSGVLAMGGDADDHAGPGSGGIGLAIAGEVLGDGFEGGEDSGVAGVAVVIDEAGEEVGGALAEVAVIPVANGHGGDFAFVIHLPKATVDVLGRRGNGGGVRPGIALQSFGGDANAVVALAVLAGIPGGDDAVLVGHGGVAEVEA